MKEYLYKQVQDYILDKIHNLEYKPGSKIPSERKISENLNINRMSVRNAISKLVEDRILYRLHGSGTFVANIKNSRGKMVVSSFTPDSFNLNMSVLGRYTNSRVLSFKVIYDNKDFKKFFNSVDAIYELCRIRYVDSKPASLEYTYFPFRQFIDAIRYDFSESSLYEYMEYKGKRPVKFDKITEVVVDEKVNIILDNKKDTPVFKTTYIGKTEDNINVEYTNSYVNLEDIEFKYIRKK
ncbi:GntR family transcriptional regulator [Helcococcus kunzii]|uniref:GntR family transcriptional regulator n=1 Tax=Helcococcus kunzii TaxID=40091 RepID=UPI0021A3B9F2|nr:GntR family transcriptional regulator [Helcococcus kunzii]MCT1796391.1 GntR family transcriptional regulator [Helcococcus kunzii]MCT1989441.1 GntR family transcriptional regulator [Helcococcus kunzii]